MGKDWPQESDLRAMPLIERLRHAGNAALVEDRESIELGMDRIEELERALLLVTMHDEKAAGTAEEKLASAVGIARQALGN